MNVHRKTIVLAWVLSLLVLAAPGGATALAPFIDLQEAGLTVVEDGEGLMFWDHTSPVNLNVPIGGTVRFALLYWAGRERPCTFNGSTCTFSQPFKDQEMVFNGTAITGTVIGTESQPVSAEGPILNIGYLADVTSLVTSGNNTFGDDNLASNLWRLDGVGLFVAYTDAADSTFYRVLVWDNLDFAYGDDPTPGETRVTSPVTFGHGATSFARTAQLWLFAGDGEANRPDDTTVSNNPTLFNVLDSVPDGPQWTTDEYTINIPANVDTTVVQMHSRPPGQNPDSMLWQMAALRVALPSDLQELPPTAPSCPTVVISGPPAQAVTTFQDTGSGLVSLVVTLSQNADTVVPPFIPGTTEPVTVTSTKIDQTQRARIEIRATDGAGNVAICDPIHLIVVRDSGKPVQEINTDVPRIEDKVTIRNGTPGLSNLDILVNGVRFKVTGLKSGQETTVDISSAMHDGNNTVNLEGRGKKGSWAEVIIWDGGGN
ncbi:MAG TPA: hypothetical protein VE685_24675 [Thermoanaerobaculia bacterium]|nr:hypothetical protein [Thermoanaerobaculia bacterium]